MQASIMLPHGEHDQERKRRNRVMCKNCRRDKQRCDPLDYDWNKGGKCQRCLKQDYPCSVPEKKERAKKKQRASEASATSDSQAAPLDTLPEMLNSDNRIVGPAGLGNLHRDPNISIAKSNGQRPIAPWSADNFEEDDGPAMDSDLPASEDFTRSGRNHETEAHHLVAKLGTLLTIRILLEQDLVHLSRIEEWIGTDAYIALCLAAVEDLNARVVEEAHRCIEQAASLIREKRQLGSYKLAFLEAIRSLRDKLNHFVKIPLPTCTNQRTNMPVDIFDDELHCLQKRKGIYSAAARVFEGAHDCTQHLLGVRRESDATQVKNFRQAGEEIKSILSELELDNPEHDKIFFGPPTQHQSRRSACVYLPCHLAARTADEGVLKQLWQESSINPWELDCFGRTAVHYGAYYACVASLESTFKHSPSLAANLGPDRFGLTPLAIAACKNDLKSFKILLKYKARFDAQDKCGRSILALAARNNSIDIVRYILASNRLPVSLSSELDEAIQKGHADIVELLMQKYNSLPRNEYSMQISRARESAQNKGEHNLAEMLISRHTGPVVNQVVTSLRAIDYSQNSAGTNPDSSAGGYPFDFGDSQKSYISDLWDYNIHSSTVSDMYALPQSLDPTSFHTTSFNDEWLENQNSSGWVND